MNIQKRNMMLYFIGSITSMFGNYIFRIAVSFYVLETTNSAFAFAVSLALGAIIPFLLSPIIGWICDNYNKKILIVSADLLSGLTMTIYLFYSQVKEMNILSVYLAVALLTVFGLVLEVAMDSSMIHFVEEKNLQKINSLNGTADSISQIFSPIIGAAVYAWMGLPIFILVNGITFFISASLELFLKFEFNKVEKKDKEKFKVNLKLVLEESKESINYLRKNYKVKNLILIMCVIYLFMLSFNVVFPYSIMTIMGYSEKLFGFFESAMALGMLVGSLYLNKKTFNNVNKALLIVLFFSGLCYCVLGFSIYMSSTIAIAITFVGVFLLGVLNMLFLILFMTEFQKSVEPSILGRVNGFRKSLASIVVLTAMLGSGALLKIIHPMWIVGTSGIILIFVVGILNFKLNNRELSTIN